METIELDLDNVGKAVLENLRNNATTIMSGISLSSPRAIGDTVQYYLADRGLKEVLSEYKIDVDSEFSRRSMEDMAFKDSKGNYYAIDVKTHNIDTDFNMPNLISVKRLATFYNNADNNNFCILIISYKVVGDKIDYTECHFKRIESFEWSCLTLGALGWGQIQIANANNLQFVGNKADLRKSWMITLCDKLSVFYDEEISKIGERKDWFKKTKEYWENK